MSNTFLFPSNSVGELAPEHESLNSDTITNKMNCPALPVIPVSHDGVSIEKQKSISPDVTKAPQAFSVERH